MTWSGFSPFGPAHIDEPWFGVGSPYLARFVAPQSPGALAALPPYWTFSRAAGGMTVQDGDNAVISGIGANVARVGRLTSSEPYGIVLEGSGANQLRASAMRDLETMPVAGVGVTYSASGVVGPDGGGAPKRVQVASGGYARSDSWTYGAPVTLGPGSTYSLWVRGLVGGESSQVVRNTVGLGIQAAACALTQAWTRVAISNDVTTAIWDVLPVDGRDWSGTGGVVAGDRDVVGDMPCLESVPWAREWHAGSHDADAFACSRAAQPSGRVASLLTFRPRMSAARLAYASSDPELIYGDAGNRVVLDRVTRIVTVTVAGASYSFGTPVPAWVAGDTLSLLIEAGGGSLQTAGTAWLNGVPTPLGVSGAPQGAWGTPGARVMHGATYGLDCALTEAAFYAS